MTDSQNLYHEQLLEQIESEAIETHYGERPVNLDEAIEWWD